MESLIKICVCLMCLKIRDAPLQQGRENHNSNVSYKEDWEEEEHAIPHSKSPTTVVRAHQAILRKRRACSQESQNVRPRVNSMSSYDNNNRN